MWMGYSSGQGSVRLSATSGVALVVPDASDILNLAQMPLNDANQKLLTLVVFNSSNLLPSAAAAPQSGGAYPRLVPRGPLVDLGPDGLTFLPGRITAEFAYDTALVTNASALGVYYFNDVTLAWELQSKATFTLGKISVFLSHFSKCVSPPFVYYPPSLIHLPSLKVLGPCARGHLSCTISALIQHVFPVHVSQHRWCRTAGSCSTSGSRTAGSCSKVTFFCLSQQVPPPRDCPGWIERKPDGWLHGEYSAGICGMERRCVDCG